MVDPHTGLAILLEFELNKPAAAWSCVSAMARPRSSLDAATSPAPRVIGMPSISTKAWPSGTRPGPSGSEELELRFSPPLPEVAYDTGVGKAWPWNSETEGEPNPFKNNTTHCFQNLFGNSFCNMAGSNLERRNLDNNDGRVNEARVALLDTACTSWLHSRRWREMYSQTLPAGTKCEATATRENFHFANGASTDDKLSGGSRSEVEQGSTPLLLSIPALDSLGAVLPEVPMLVTRTGHLAVEVAYCPDAPAQEQRAPGTAAPRALSEVADFMPRKPPILCCANWPPRTRTAPSRLRSSRVAPRLCIHVAFDLEMFSGSSQRGGRRSCKGTPAELWHKTNGPGQQFGGNTHWRNAVIYEPFAGNLALTAFASEVHGVGAQTIMTCLKIQAKVPRAPSSSKGATCERQCPGSGPRQPPAKHTLRPSFAVFTGLRFLTNVCNDCISAAPPGCHVSKIPSRGAIVRVGSESSPFSRTFCFNSAHLISSSTSLFSLSESSGGTCGGGAN